MLRSPINLVVLKRWSGIQSLSTQAPSLKLDNVGSAEWANAKPYESIPGPSRYELFRGFLPGGEYHKKSFTDYILHAREQYGDVYRMPGMFGKKDMVMAFNVDDVQKVYRTEGIWPSRPGMDSLVYYRNKYRSELYGKAEGLIASKGKQWGSFRTAVNPVLMQPRNAKSYVIPMQDVNSEFIKRIREIRDPKTLEVPGNFVDDINRLTFESVAVVALDKQLGLIRKNRDSEDAAQLFKSLTSFLHYLYVLDYQPSLYKYIWSPTFEKYRKALDNIFDTTIVYVDECLKRIKAKNLKDPEDRELSVLEKLIQIDKDVAVVMAMDMLMAGVDTTSTILTGILLEVAKNTDKQKKLREEVRKVLPSKDSTFTVEAMKNLPYLRACIKEGIRMHPIGPGVTRNVGEDITLSGYQVPKGTQMVLNVSLLSMEEKFFSRPKEYIPERWIRNDPLEMPITPFSYIPFGFGPRMCVGRRIVDLELEVTVARLLRNFYMEFNYPIDNAFRSDFINVPNIPLKFKFTELED